MNTSTPALITPELARSLMPRRADDTHKGSFGRALIIAGSRQYTGAAKLALQAASRSGAGLVFAAIPEPLHAPLAASLSEPIWLILPTSEGAIAAEAGEQIPYSDGKMLFFIGPGLSQPGRYTRFLLTPEHLRGSPELPFVIDALNLLSKEPDWKELLPSAVLTPHEMEFSRLTGLPLSEIHSNRGISPPAARKNGNRP